MMQNRNKKSSSTVLENRSPNRRVALHAGRTFDLMNVFLTLFVLFWVMVAYLFHRNDVLRREQINPHVHHRHLQLPSEGDVSEQHLDDTDFDRLGFNDGAGRPALMATRDQVARLRGIGHDVAVTSTERRGTDLTSIFSNTEMSRIISYATSKVTKVKRLKETKSVKWGNGHDNRIWLATLKNEKSPVIFKTNHLDMMFTDPSGLYDPKAPYYINNEYALLSWINEFLAYALDRAVGLNMVPVTSVRQFSQSEFAALFGPRVNPTLNLKTALGQDPVSRTGMFRYTPPWYDGTVVEGAMVELVTGATRITDTVCSTFCKNRVLDSRGVPVCVVDHGRFIPSEQISDMLFMDFLLNTIDREVNCFVVPDPSAADAALPSDPAKGKASLLRMIDNESAEWSPPTQTRPRRKESVSRYNAFRQPHGYQDGRMMSAFIERAARTGMYGLDECGFEPSTPAKFAVFWQGSPRFQGETLGEVVEKTLLGLRKELPENKVLDGVLQHELEGVKGIIDDRLDVLMEHVKRCPASAVTRLETNTNVVG